MSTRNGSTPYPSLSGTPTVLRTGAVVMLLGAVLVGCRPGGPTPTADAPAATGAATGAGAVAAGRRPGTPTTDGSTAGKPGPSTSDIDLDAHSTTDPASIWVVVNKAHPLDPIDAEPDDLVVVHGYLVRSVVADDLSALLDAAAADGVGLTLRSAYRSYGKQQTVHTDLVDRLGADAADRVSARPGYSEHQTGLAVDIGSATQSRCDFEQCFADTDAGRWLAAHAAEHGFLVRYTSENESITGYSPEAWHVRYVGRDLAAAMQRRGVTTLEEMFGVSGGATYR